MAYSAKAQMLRRCTATTKAGTRCARYAVWGDDRCYDHGGARWILSSREQQRRSRHDRHASYPPCACAAYPFPHRPGGGRCRWPHEQPGGPKPVERPLSYWDDFVTGTAAIAERRRREGWWA